MRSFEEVLALAAILKGGLDAVEAALAATPTLEPTAVAAIPDDRILAEMTRRVFNAGFSSKVVESKWPAFEAAFDAFDPRSCAFMSEEHFDALLSNTAIVRNGSKIRSVSVNAQLLVDLAAQHGSAARFFAGWPDENFVGLLHVLKERGSHLSGEAGMRFLRALGRPAFITTKDVTAALIREEVLTKPPKSRRDFEQIQQAFNEWSAQSGRNLTEISRILAMSV